jgi:hypothetical protein
LAIDDVAIGNEMVLPSCNGAWRWRSRTEFDSRPGGLDSGRAHSAESAVSSAAVDVRHARGTGPTATASPERLNYLRTQVTEGRLPQWTAWWDEDDVAVLFPDPQTRLTVSAEQPRLPLSYCEQQIPVPGDWDNRPCGYLLFGPSYNHVAQDARLRGWDVDQVPGQHLHQLVDPDAVAARIVTMTGRWRLPAG